VVWFLVETSSSVIGLYFSTWVNRESSSNVQHTCSICSVRTKRTKGTCSEWWRIAFALPFAARCMSQTRRLSAHPQPSSLTRKQNRETWAVCAGQHQGNDDQTANQSLRLQPTTFKLKTSEPFCEQMVLVEDSINHTRGWMDERSAR